MKGKSPKSSSQPMAVALVIAALAAISLLLFALIGVTIASS